MDNNKYNKCKTNILFLINDVKSCARQVKIMNLIGRLNAEYDQGKVPFNSFFGWLQASNTQIGMLISQIYKLANLNESKNNLSKNLSNVFNKVDVEKLFDWTDLAKEWELLSKEYYEKFRFVRHKYISHAVYETLLEELKFELTKMYCRLAYLDTAFGLLLFLVNNRDHLNQKKPFTDKHKKSPVLQLDEFFQNDPSIQDFQNLLNFIQNKFNPQLNLIPHLYPSQ